MIVQKAAHILWHLVALTRMNTGTQSLGGSDQLIAMELAVSRQEAIRLVSDQEQGQNRDPVLGDSRVAHNITSAPPLIGQ